jgi:hypothetical protein
MDAAMASLLILLTAVDEGLGSCFFGIPPEHDAAVREAFGIPSEVAITEGDQTFRACDVAVATFWRTAYLLAEQDQCAKAKVYFMQDYYREHASWTATVGFDGTRLGATRGSVRYPHR